MSTHKAGECLRIKLATGLVESGGKNLSFMEDRIRDRDRYFHAETVSLKYELFKRPTPKLSRGPVAAKRRKGRRLQRLVERSRFAAGRGEGK